jgi:hypothetical protein
MHGCVSEKKLEFLYHSRVQNDPNSFWKWESYYETFHLHWEMRQNGINFARKNKTIRNVTTDSDREIPYLRGLSVIAIRIGMIYSKLYSSEGTLRTCWHDCDVIKL